MFSFKGISAKSMSLRVLNNVVFNSPSRDTNLIHVPGRNGNLVKDNGRYGDVLRSIPCRLESSRENVEQMVSKIHHWLVKDVGYHEFLWHGDADFVYSARVDSNSVSRRRLTGLADTFIDFQLYPIKYLRSSMVEREIDNGRVLVNSMELDAKPLVRIIGTGLVVLTVDDKIMEINIPENAGGCVIDSETRIITSLDGKTALFRNARGEYPVLAVGNNVVLWSGANDVQVFVTPRLGALV